MTAATATTRAVSTMPDAAINPAASLDRARGSAVEGLSDIALLQLLRLVSPSLPIGGFAWSQGLEFAIDSGKLTDADDIAAWLEGVMKHNLTNLDLPLLLRLHGASHAGAREDFEHWNGIILASRETHELYEEDIHLGAALYRLLASPEAALLGAQLKPASVLCGFAEAAVRHSIPAPVCALGWLWSWLENQLTVASKTLPLGQTDVQLVLQRLIPAIPGCVTAAVNVRDEELGASFPGFAIMSARHETQYSRLFRS